MTCVYGGIYAVTFNYTGDGIFLNSQIETVARIVPRIPCSPKATLVLNAVVPAHYTQDPHLRSTPATLTESNTLCYPRQEDRGATSLVVGCAFFVAALLI
jgi:hypothetical protein